MSRSEISRTSHTPATGVAGLRLVENGDMIRIMMQLGYDYIRQDELHLQFGVTRADMKKFLAAHPRVEFAFKKGQLIHKLLDRYRAMVSGRTPVLIRLGCAMLGQELPRKSRSRNRRQKAGHASNYEPAEGRWADGSIGIEPTIDEATGTELTEQTQASQEASEPAFQSRPVPLSRLIRRMK